MKLKRNQLWKSLKAGLQSHGNFTWELNKWCKVDGKVKACNNGFHGSKRIIDAIKYVNCECLAIAEVKGKSDKSEEDKQAWQQMKLVKAYKWEKKHSVMLAIFAAEQVIKIYEKKYPNDDRPRKAIEEAKNWLANPTDAAAAAAYAAAAAAAAAYAADEKVLNKCEGYILKEIVPTLEVIKL